MTRELSLLRTKHKLKAVKASLRATHATRSDFRVVHFSLQDTHLHLLVEAKDKHALSRGLRALHIRIARRLNQLANRTVRVFSDRYHARALATPTETRRSFRPTRSPEIAERAARAAHSVQEGARIGAGAPAGPGPVLWSQ